MNAKKIEILGALAVGCTAGWMLASASGCAVAWMAVARADDATVTTVTCKTETPISYELPDSDPATWPRLSAWLSDDGSPASQIQLQGIAGTTARFGSCPAAPGGGLDGVHKITFVLR